ncbi:MULTISPECIES: hypothetical protein [unclassified Devosia]|uniref:hypothetical protein n=1 Tax=unclassified Devosia TaxID=196773 RepID=UPI001AC3E431|nr:MULTISPECIES: hypothetical protein [unclassified Devosia]MBN9307626.1 hypothetical protein [Devosia sp.]
MDRAAAEREAIRLWRNLPVQDRLTQRQAQAFAAMIAPTLEFEAPEKRARIIADWLEHDLAKSDIVVVDTGEDDSGHQRLQAPPWPTREGASALAFAISLLVMIARRPDILSNAMLWAEDGAVYFADAWNRGALAALFLPFAGTLQLFPRGVYGLATLLPVQFVPLFGVWAALLVRAAIPAFLFSSRFPWIDWRAKVAVAAYFLLMPNLAEVHVNPANTHWYLGLYLLAVVLADAPRTRRWQIHDWAVLLVAGLSGPMILFVLPALLWRSLAQRHTTAARRAYLGVAAALAALQLVLIVVTALGRETHPTYDTGFFAIPVTLVSHVILGFITPNRWIGALSVLVIAVPALVLGLAVMIAVLVRGDWRARGVTVIPVLVVAAAIYTPMFRLSETQWAPLFGVAGDGYFVVTGIAWAVTLVYFSTIYLPRLSNEALAALVLVAGLLILFDFPLPPVAGPPFAPEAARIAAAPAGEPLIVPISPPGWEMELDK